MADTADGGVYKDATGDGYHDAQGNKLTEDEANERLAEHDRLQEEKGEPTRAERLDRSQKTIEEQENRRRGAQSNTPVVPVKGSGSGAPDKPSTADKAGKSSNPGTSSSFEGNPGKNS